MPYRLATPQYIFAFRFHLSYSLAYYTALAKTQSFFRVGYNTKTSFVQSYGVYEHSFLATMRLDFLPIEMHQ